MLKNVIYEKGPAFNPSYSFNMQKKGIKQHLVHTINGTWGGISRTYKPFAR